MSTGSEPGSHEVTGRRKASPDERRHQRRLVAATFLGALIAAFAVLNTDDVKVHWIVSTSHSPLIIVIVVAFIVGGLFDRLLVRRQRKRKEAAPPS